MSFILIIYSYWQCPVLILHPLNERLSGTLMIKNSSKKLNSKQFFYYKSENNKLIQDQKLIRNFYVNFISIFYSCVYKFLYLRNCICLVFFYIFHDGELSICKISRNKNFTTPWAIFNELLSSLTLRISNKWLTSFLEPQKTPHG